MIICKPYQSYIHQFSYLKGAVLFKQDKEKPISFSGLNISLKVCNSQVYKKNLMTIYST